MTLLDLRKFVQFTQLIGRTGLLTDSQLKPRQFIRVCCRRRLQEFSVGKSEEFSNNKLEKSKSDSQEDSLFDEIKSSRNKDNVYISSHKFAEKVANDYITSQYLNIFEVNAGPGILTKMLLKKPSVKLRVFETKPEYITYIKRLQGEFDPQRLQICPISLFNLASLTNRDKLFHARYVERMFEGIEPRKWEEDPQLLIVGVLPPSKERSFVINLAFDVCVKSTIFSYGRIEILLLMSYKLYTIITACKTHPKYNFLAVLFHLFFNVIFLCKEPISSFSRLYRKTNTIIRDRDFDHLYMVRITPKENLSFKLPENVEMQDLFYFIRQNFFNKSTHVISKLEAGIPFCGSKLIKAGYTMTTQFKDLGPDDAVALFLEICRWPEYDESTFRTALKSISMRNDMTLQPKFNSKL